MKKYFYLEESANQPGKFLVKIDFDQLPPMTTTGSYNLLPAHLLGISYAEYLRFCRADGKTQVSVEYDEQGHAIGIDTVVVSVMHSAEFEMEELRKYIREGVIAPVLKNYGFDIADVAHIHINPTGNFVIGGPNGDTDRKSTRLNSSHAT